MVKTLRNMKRMRTFGNTLGTYGSAEGRPRYGMENLPADSRRGGEDVMME